MLLRGARINEELTGHATLRFNRRAETRRFPTSYSLQNLNAKLNAIDTALITIDYENTI